MKKVFGSVRVLIVEEIIIKKEKREAQEAEQAIKKARVAVLKGKTTFVKEIWKEFKMGVDVFS